MNEVNCMKYLLLKLGKEQYWYELDEEGYASRQINVDEDGQIHVSCLEDCLAEGLINEDDLEGYVIHLSKQEFENLWQTTLKKYEVVWKDIKKKYPIGIFVQGKCSYSYPQGSIIRGNDFIAIYIGEESFCLNKLVQYKVKSYDEKNMWLVVE